jgi:16S rRNA (cytosine1402-N4)-methyltransferase
MLFTPPTPESIAVHHTATAVGARTPELGTFSMRCGGLLGTGATAAIHTDVRTASGWLSARRPESFMAGRRKSLGTEFPALFKTMVRAASGWLWARPSEFFIARQDATLGTAERVANSSDVRTASGWLSERRPEFFMAGRRKSLGTEFPTLFKTMVRAASGWLLARPSEFSMSAAEARSDGGYHLPVLPDEVVEWSGAGPDTFVIDGTLGGGGHSELFLKAGARVMGVDRDPEALAHARARLAVFGDRFTWWEGNFSKVIDSPAIQSGDLADVLLMDLGVSSRQLDSAERGFSFQKDGPLDMRMGPSSPRTAADVVNTWPEADLVKIFFEFGEEPKARRIASAIVKRRAVRPFTTTLDLAGYIEQTIGRHGRTHPATRTFQAIRMAVNEELESLAVALAAAPSVLKPGGRLCIITFHSLEDRMVKRFLKHRSTAFLDEPGWPEPRPNPDYQFRLVSRKAIAPTASEISLNPRARSAKLRVAQLLAPNA